MFNHEILDAHFLTYMIIVGTVLVTPMYLVLTYHYSGASIKKGVIIGSAWLVFGAIMSWVVVARVPDALGPVGALLVPLCWILPSAILWLKRDWFLSEPLDQHWLVGLQVFRIVGAAFLIEYTRQNLPGVFALPAGIGDVLVGIVAVIILVSWGKREYLPHWSIVLVLVIGLTDFASAFFFGYFSSDGPVQLFFPAIENRNLVYPLGLIPLFLVPYAIFFHALSWISFANERSAGFARK